MLGVTEHHGCKMLPGNLWSHTTHKKYNDTSSLIKIALLTIYYVKPMNFFDSFRISITVSKHCSSPLTLNSNAPAVLRYSFVIGNSVHIVQKTDGRTQVAGIMACLCSPIFAFDGFRSGC